MSDCSQPSSVSGRSPPPTNSSVCGSAGRLRCSSRRSRPRVASSGWPTARWLVSSRRGDRAAQSGQRTPQVVAGMRQPQVQVVVGGQRVEQFDLGDRQPGVAEQRQPRRQVGRRLPQPGNGFLRAGRAVGRRRRGRPARATAAAASAGRRRGRRCAPSSQSTSSCGRWRAYDANRPAMPTRHGVAPALPEFLLLARARSGRGGWPASCTTARRGCSSITSSSGQTIASGDHGSSSAVPVISAISECGLRNATPAQTPSAPLPRPRMCDSRWLSHRSTPRAGTSTSSSANGSGSGSASSAPRPSASRSVRSARWRWRAIDRNDRGLPRHGSEFVACPRLPASDGSPQCRTRTRH